MNKGHVKRLGEADRRQKGRWPFWQRLLLRKFFDHRFQSGAQSYDLWIGWLTIACVSAVVVQAHAPQHSDMMVWVSWLDRFLLAALAFDYGLRTWLAPITSVYRHRVSPRWAYMRSLKGLVDGVSVLMLLGICLEPNLYSTLWLRVLLSVKLLRFMLPAWEEFVRINAGRRLRQRLFSLIEPSKHSGVLHHYVDNFFVFWVIVSVLCIVLESVSSPELAAFKPSFRMIEILSLIVFSLEYATRLYCAPEDPQWRGRRAVRWRQALTPTSIIDFLSILPAVLELLVHEGLDLRFLRVFRLLRLLKLTRYTGAVNVLYQVVRREWQVIFAAVFVMMLLVIFTASVGYLFEHEAQPDKFENIPQSIYWAVITLASVGYGDISPITPMGRALTVVLALLGIGIFAIPAGLLASAFTDQLRLDRDAFRSDVIAALESGVADPLNHAQLAEQAARLHLSPSDVRRIASDAAAVMKERESSLARHEHAALLDPKQYPDLALQQASVWLAQIESVIHEPAVSARLHVWVQDADPQKRFIAERLVRIEDTKPAEKLR